MLIRWHNYFARKNHIYSFSVDVKLAARLLCRDYTNDYMIKNHELYQLSYCS
jgi:hypothetical protein